MPNSFEHRAHDTEIMDDFSLEGEELIHALRDLTRINKWLGGDHIILSGISRIIDAWPATQKSQPIRILDLGCGGGDSLRALANWGAKQNLPLTLMGIDANATTIEYAQKASRDFNNIEFAQGDVLDPTCRFDDYDIVIYGLFLHHLREEEQIQLIQKSLTAGVKGLLINDLQRSKLAYVLFYFVSRIFGFSAMSRHDGALSIRKGFHQGELISLMKKCNIKTYSLKWKWAFRYQLIAQIS